MSESISHRAVMDQRDLIIVITRKKGFIFKITFSCELYMGFDEIYRATTSRNGPRSQCTLTEKPRSWNGARPEMAK